MEYTNTNHSRLIWPTIILITTMMCVVSSCSSRMEAGLLEDDQTMVYPSKITDGVNARITFCRKVDKKTGDKIGVGTVFTAMEKGNMKAYVDLENVFLDNKQDLMFHFDWIGANGKSFYLKRIDLSTDDSTNTISSSVSLTPETRLPGEYTLRIFLFRELIAEKKFEILPPYKLLNDIGEKMQADIALYRKISKKSGKPLGEGSEFAIKKKAKVRALVELENRFVYGNQELKLLLDWVGRDEKSIYSKKIDLYPNDSTSSFNSSISITPGKRAPGNYYFRVYLYNELISEQEFELLE